MLETIRKTVVIPENHKLNIDLDVPESIPAGEVELVLVIASSKKRTDNSTLMALAGSLSDSKIFSKDPVAIQKELRDEWQ